MANQPNGVDHGEPPQLVKKLFGVPNERGGMNWLDECPDYFKADSHSPDHAIVVRYKEERSKTTKKSLNLTSIDVQSPYLKQILRQVFRSYPGMTIDEEDLSFDAPFWPFFHQWPTLTSVYEKAKRDKDGHPEQIETLLNVLGDELNDDIRDIQSLVKNGNITFRLLWMLFPPGTPVVSQWKKKPHLFLINEAKYLMGEIIPTLAIEMLLLDHDGERYGWHKASVFVQAFLGSISISTLPAVPLQFQEDADSLLETLYNRGAAGVALIGQSPAYRAYDGPIRVHRDFDFEEIDIFVEGRTIIDAKTHSMQASRYAPTVYTIPHRLEALLPRDPLTKAVTFNDSLQQSHGLLSVFDNLSRHPALSAGVTKLKKIPLTDPHDQSLLKRHRWTESLVGIPPETFCRSVLRGYCLTSKAWAEFEIDNVEDIKWNVNAFDALVIPPARKRLLEALVKQQRAHKKDADFDDIVAGKGQGLIMLLTGPPGTGKTLTAESIADRLQLPLYAVSANELGDRITEIENQFGQVLRMAAAWNAVLLVDEADAFLDKRVDAPEARERNKRVAAFLRILEYYKGILILTTNRIVNFDDAFYSRIHLTLPFKAFDLESRQDIWRNFLRETQISDADLKHFASEELNGRQIKNVMKMARLLAKDEGEPLRAGHITDVLAVAREDFEPMTTT